MTVICVECEGVIHADCDVLGEYVFMRCGKCHDKKILRPSHNPTLSEVGATPPPNEKKEN